MRLSSSALLILFTLGVNGFAAAELGDHKGRGYEARVCGLDLDDDGIVGEASDCDVCDSTSGSSMVAVDWDGDSTTESEVYVDMTSGADSGSCGTPDSPCATLAYAIDNRSGLAAGEDAYCVKGTGGTGDDLIDDIPSGDAGTRWDQSGDEAFPVAVPTNPTLIVAWDDDNDGNYHEDMPIFDGTDDEVFLWETGVSRVELAHLRFDNITDPIWSPSGVTSGERDSWYLHDLEVNDIASFQLFNVFGCQNGNSGDDLLFRNILVDGQAVTEDNFFYAMRGECDGTGFTRRTRWRFDNYTYRDVIAAGGGDATHVLFDVWGSVDHVEFRDIRIEGTSDGHALDMPNFGSPAQCIQDVWVTNVFCDQCGSFVVESADNTFCDVDEITGPVIVDRLEWYGDDDHTGFGDVIFVTIDNVGDGDSRIENFTLRNSTMVDGDSAQRNCVRLDVGQNTEAYTAGAEFVFDGNTFVGCINGIYVENEGSATHVLQKVTIRGNAFYDNGDNIDDRTGGSNWTIEDNSYDAGNWRWNSTEYSTGAFATWETASGDTGSDLCTPVFEDSAGDDWRPALHDTCILGARTSALTSAIDRANKQRGDDPSRGGLERDTMYPSHLRAAVAAQYDDDRGPTDSPTIPGGATVIDCDAAGDPSVTITSSGDYEIRGTCRPAGVIDPGAGTTNIVCEDSTTLILGSNDISPATVAWTSDTGDWYVTGQTQDSTDYTQGCQSGWTNCEESEAVYLDGVHLTPVTSKANLDQDDEFYFDYAADRIYLNFDPELNQDLVIEATSEEKAFDLSDSTEANPHTVRNCTVKFFNASAEPPVETNNVIDMGAGAIFEYSYLGQSGGVGIMMDGDGSTVQHSIIEDIGRLGIGGNNDDLTVENVAIRRVNRDKGHSYVWEAGCTKFATGNVDNLLLANSTAEDCLGPGWWTDIDVGDAVDSSIVFRDLWASGNQEGVRHEIAFAATIERVIAMRNEDAQIAVANSEDTIVRDSWIQNTIVDSPGVNSGLSLGNDCRTSPANYYTRDVTVENNIFVSEGDNDGCWSCGYVVSMQVSPTTTSGCPLNLDSTLANWFNGTKNPTKIDNNRYVLLGEEAFVGQSGSDGRAEINWSSWQGLGLDTNSEKVTTRGGN